MINILNSKKPLNIKKCDFICDRELDKKLNKFDLTKQLNKHCINLFVAPPKSGKTSFLYSLFATNSLLKKVYHSIYLFQPSHSRASMSDNIFDELPEEQKFDELTVENLQQVVDSIKAEEPEYNSCIIFDDVGAYMRDNGVKQLLKEIAMNKRHYHVSVFILCQTWKSIEPSIRMLVDNYFIWKCSKLEMKNIFDEVLSMHSDKSDEINNLVYDKAHNFLMLTPLDRKIFKNWDQIIISNNL